MVLISKHDKKIWENYVSNFEKYTVIKQNNSESIAKIKFDNTGTNNKDKRSNNIKSIRKKKTKPDAVIDLHGYTIYSAKIILNNYIVDCYERNIRNILIVTGKGKMNKGKLKEEVPKWLNETYLNRYLVSINLAPNHFGGDGALLVRIKNRFKKFK